MSKAQTEKRIEEMLGDLAIDKPADVMVAQTAVTQTGRGPSGKLRNFGAMNRDKLAVTWQAMELEANDAEGLQQIRSEVLHRLKQG